MMVRYALRKNVSSLIKGSGAILDAGYCLFKTSSILADYYAIRTYEDTQVLDSLDLTITDTVSQNQILGRKNAYNFTYPRKTIKETIYLNKRELYFGVGVTGNPDQLQYLGGEMVYKNKKRQAYGLGVGVDQNLVPVISVRMYWKLGK